MNLTEENFLDYARTHYENNQCVSTAEFEQDLKIFSHLQKLFNRWRKKRELRERLILNHIIVLYNVFGVAATNLLLHRISITDHSVLLAFLVHLGKIPAKTTGVDHSMLELLKDL